MGRENGFAYQVLVLIVIIIIAIAGVCINKVVGRKGVIDRVTTVETEYSKEDVLEKINHKITQKFIEINNQAKQENKNISELYNSDVVISYLKESGFISDVIDDAGNVIPDIFNINLDSLKDENDEVQYSGEFKLQKIEDKYKVVFYNKEGESEEIGELEIQQIK